MNIDVEADDDYRTLGSFVMTSLQRVPAPLDALAEHGWRSKLMAIDGDRVD